MPRIKRLLLHASYLDEPPEGKKNSPSPAWPALFGRYRYEGKPVGGLVRFLYMLEHMSRVGQTAAVSNALGWAARSLRPKIVPAKPFQKWERRFLRSMAALQCDRPLVPNGTPLLLRAKFFLGPRQRPDLLSLLQGLADALEKGKIIGNDYWIAGFLDSQKLRPTKAEKPTWVPGVEFWIYEAE